MDSGVRTPLANGCHKDPYPSPLTNGNLHYRSFSGCCVFEWGMPHVFFNGMEKADVS